VVGHEQNWSALWDVTEALDLDAPIEDVEPQTGQRSQWSIKHSRVLLDTSAAHSPAPTSLYKN
jgi:hypothetical protein